MFSELAKNDLKRLRDEGYSITDEEVIALNDLAVQIEAGKETTAANHPRFAFAGNVILHEPTVGALEWWWSFGRDAAWTTKGKLNTYYFMLANARNVELLAPLQKPSDINKAVKLWMKSVNATDGELFRALLYVKHSTEYVDEDNDKKIDEEGLDSIWNLLLICAGQMGVKLDDLKTCTQSELMRLIKHSAKAGLQIKPSIAKLYIKYQMMVKQIENRGNKHG